MTAYAIPLDAPDVTLATAGGKAANLRALLCAGFPVPRGFVVPTAAYRDFVTASGLAERILALGRGAEPDDPESFERAAAAIGERFAAAPVPDDLAAAIAAGYRALGQPAVAVRSSATAEDLPTASFAGQQDTYLNVHGESALLDAVRRCWASLWTARALAYRARQGIDPGTVALAVVVQELVPADAAGILFTVNPVTGARDEVVVNASWGLGEAVVGGRVNPDTLTLDKATGRVKRFELGDKAIMTAPMGEGTAEVEVPAGRRAQAVLTAAQAAALARLGHAIEAHLGSPQDIEWAIAGDQVSVLQARPITTLAGVPGDDDWPAAGVRAQHPSDLWTQADMGERWPEPVTPLTWSTALDMTNRNMRYGFRDLRAPYLDHIQWAARFYGRVYLNEGAMAQVMMREYGLPSTLMAATLGSGISGAETPRQRIRPLCVLRALPGTIGLSVARWRNEGVFRRLFPRIDAWVAAFMRCDLAPLDDRSLWDELGGVWMPRLLRAVDLHGDITSSAMVSVPLFERLVEWWLGRKELAHELLAGLSDVRQAEMVPALYGMARQLQELGLAGAILESTPEEALAGLRADPRAALFLTAFDAFLAAQGHRCAIEAEWRYPRWIEAPAQVIEAIGGYLRAGDRPDPAVVEMRQRRRRAQALARAAARLGPLRRAIFRRMLTRTQELVRLRDNGQHYVVKLLLPPRHIVAELGMRWAARGWLGHADDIFFLGIAEIGRIIQAGDPGGLGRDSAALVAGRRRAYEHWFTVRAPEIVDRDGAPVVTATTVGDGTLVGIPASGGQVRGTARIVPTIAEAGRIQPGDILVTRATDPGWTPVFPLVDGLVLEIGGQLSHGAIVAREYGIPAVVNVADATLRIRNGQSLLVDGTSGRVYIEDGASEAVGTVEEE